jgi:alpha-mannosidase
VSTIKKCEDDDSVIVRLYDIEGKDATLTLTPFFPLAKAELVNMIEEEEKALPCGNEGLTMTLGHHAIETLKLKPGTFSKKASSKGTPLRKASVMSADEGQR